MGKAGRPKALKPKEKRFSVRLDAEMESALSEYCKNTGISKGQAIRQGIMLLLAAGKRG